MKKRLLSVFVGLGIAAVALLLLDGLGWMSGIAISHFNPSHPEKHGHIINIFRGIAFALSFGVMFGFGGWMLYLLGQEAIEIYEGLKRKVSK